MKKRAFSLMAGLLCTATLCFSGCLYIPSISSSDNAAEQAGISSIEKTSSDGLVDTYTIYFSDGTTATFTVTNGKDGADGKDGQDGKDGADGQDITAQSLYEKYVEEYGDISYADFLQIYTNCQTDDYAAVNYALRSSVKIYSETQEYTDASKTQTKAAVHTGAGVLYRMDENYTYILTNYHVVYNEDAVEPKLSQKNVCYLYGSEGGPSKEDDGSVSYDSYALHCELIGGAATYDLAMLRVETQKVKAINPNAKPIDLADDYIVGQTAIAIGNPNSKGISVTKGIVSVDSESISLTIGGETRKYRSLRMDTPVYKGNSGGGLFNVRGELIGLVNAGNVSDQNINYAIPLSIIKAVTSNIFHYHFDNAEQTKGVYKATIGVTVTSQNSKFVYNESLGYGKIEEEILVVEVTAGGIAERMGLQKDDVITAIIIDGVKHTLTRYYSIGDFMLGVTESKTFSFEYTREGESKQTSAHTILKEELLPIA